MRLRRNLIRLWRNLIRHRQESDLVNLVPERGEQMKEPWVSTGDHAEFYDIMQKDTHEFANQSERQSDSQPNSQAANQPCSHTASQTAPSVRPTIRQPARDSQPAKQPDSQTTIQRTKQKTDNQPDSGTASQTASKTPIQPATQPGSKTARQRMTLKPCSYPGGSCRAIAFWASCFDVRVLDHGS